MAAGRVAGPILIAGMVALPGCSAQPFGGGGLFGDAPEPADEGTAAQRENVEAFRTNDSSTIFDLFENQDDPNTTVEVNRYIWRASLEVLDFLPVESVDPFSGVITTGYGTPPGGDSAYRANILVQDPALDARSLELALATRSGPVDADTLRAVEDSILTRARQLRLADSRL